MLGKPSISKKEVKIMALVSQGWKLVVGLVDRGGKTVNRTFDFVGTDTAGDASALMTDATTALANLAAVTELKVKSYQLTKVFVEDTLTLPNSAEAEAEQQLSVSALIYQQPTESATYRIPGPKQALFQAASGPGADLPNFSNSALDTFLEMFSFGGSNIFYISDGEHWDVNTAKGKKTHARSTNG